MVEFADKRYRFVWPKDGPQGSRPRGFFGGLNDILTGRGPDIYLQKGRSAEPIKPDQWGNWEGYHNLGAFMMEQAGPFARRGFKRYDPHTRTYRHWYTPADWGGVGVDGQGPPWPNGDGYPHFTMGEAQRMGRTLHRGQPVNPLKMGHEWNHQGPKRYRQEHDWFWQNAHRLGDNRAMGLPPGAPINPFFLMHQNFPWDLNYWLAMEPPP